MTKKGVSASLRQVLEKWCDLERLPNSYLDNALTHFYPLVDPIMSKASKSGKDQVCVVGVSGSYGSGKSTLCSFLSLCLKEKGLTSIAVSIDDFYLPKAERNALAATIHPLLSTRGVPGTHDTKLFQKFRNDVRLSSKFSIPSFSKAQDDRFPITHWTTFEGKVDVLLLDGWCVGIPSLSTLSAASKRSNISYSEDLKTPINQLEREEDSSCVWRHHVETSLQSLEKHMFAVLDLLVFLKVPDFASVLKNRQLQESKLREVYVEKEDNSSVSKPMTVAEVERFVQFSERLTRRSFETLPQIADFVFELDNLQKVSRSSSNL